MYVPLSAPNRPTKEQLRDAEGKAIPDVIAPDLKVLFCGINPGLYSGATGYHFARPGNRFWPALHRAGFTVRQLPPHEVRELLKFNCGVTNLVARTTARADELSQEELMAGVKRLKGKVRSYRPAYVAMLGICAYRQAFGRPKAGMGRQKERLDEAMLWVLPNPSGLNAHYQLNDLARMFRALRRAVEKKSG